MAVPVRFRLRVRKQIGSRCIATLFVFGAENETRTRDPDLGKVVLYQLSYFRIRFGTANIHFSLVSPPDPASTFSLVTLHVENENTPH